MILLLLLTLLLSLNIRAQEYFYFQLPAVPLAVRSPYLNSWLHYNGNSSVFGQTWPTSFNRSQILGWSVLVRVDGLTYSFLGDVDPTLINATVNSTIYWINPLTTILTAHAGPMQVNLTFFNPIEINPQDWVKQSIPFSYMSFAANSIDGASHDVQVYSDVSGEWNSGDRTQQIQWHSTFNSDVVFHSVTLKTLATFTEILDQAEWGTLYYAMKAEKNVTYQIASDAESRGNFTRSGGLNNQQDPPSRPINDNFTVFAISRDLGTIQATNDPVVWAIGYTTDPAINYSDLSGAPPTPRSPYYKIQYSTDADLIVDFLNDFSNASSRAQEVDEKIFQDSESVAYDLSRLTFIAIAELYGSMQLTVGNDAHGNLNKSDVMIFMKNIGGVEKNRVNAVETLYAAFPALMYIDPALGGPLLEPLFRLQDSRNYTIRYAAADLGSNYPTVSGSNSNHSQGVEQTGNMLIMTYAHARASGDGSLIGRYYRLLTSWADYLNTSTLFITNQSSADNLTVNNQTNLAIKGIIAIVAMSQMSSVLNQTDDANKYSSAAAHLYAQWKSLALSSDQHLLAVYGESDSWTLGYNLFADVWLGTNLVEPAIYNGHGNFIENLVLTSNLSTFGMPIDNAIPADTSVAVSSWSFFTAAMTPNQALRSALISKVYHRTLSPDLPGAFPVYYDSVNGTTLQGVASPAQGAVFAPLALNVHAQTINVNGVTAKTNLPSPKHRNSNVGAIIGGTLGGVAAILAVVGVVTFVQRRQRRRRSRPRSILSFSTDSMDVGPQLMVTPFDPNSSETTQVSGISAEQQPLVIGGPDAEMVALQHLSSSPPSVRPLSPPVAPVPVGLSDKEMARLRTEALNSPQPRHIGASTSNASQSMSSPSAITESGEAMSPYDTRRLHSEVESLRREMERLRAEGLVIAAPPSYTEGDG